MFNEFFIGGMAGVISRSVVAPIELLKIQKQAHFIPHSTLKDVCNKEGIRFFWKGNLANCSRVFPLMAINYTIFKNTQKINENLFPNKKYISNFISGAFAGSTSMAITYPLETTKTYLSLQTNKNKFKGIYDVLKKVPVKQIYQGVGVSMFGFASWSGIQYATYFKLSEKFKDTPYDSKLLLGGIAGSTAITITYPTDLLRRRLQLQGFDKSVPVYNNVFHAIKQIFKNEGIFGFYRGISINYMKTFPQAALQFWLLENLNLLLKNKNI